MIKDRLYFPVLFLVLSLPLVVLGKDAIEVGIDTGSFKDGILPRGKRITLGATLQNRTNRKGIDLFSVKDMVLPLFFKS